MRAYERNFAAQVAAIISKYVNRAVALMANYERVTSAFGDRVFESFKSHPMMIEYKDAEDIFAVQTEGWISRNSATKAVGITETTLGQIQSAFEAGFAENLTGTEVAKRITQKAGGVIARTRAITIARTETHAASQVGSLEAAKSTNIPLKKVWVAAEDERTRETHNIADNRYHDNPVNIDDNFVVGGDSMTAPGLGSDPAENINCRCVVTFKTT
jgi:uncharacterized protein with gpF-like domain